MAEAIILPIAKSILGKIGSFTGDSVISSVSEELKAAKSAEKDLNKIADKLTAICAVLHDAEEKKYSNEAMKVWLRDLKRVVYDIDDLLDEVAFDALQRRVNEGRFRRKLRYYLSSSNPIIFSFHVSHKIRDLCEQLEHIVAKKNDFGLTESPVEYSTADIRNPFDRSSYVHVPDVMGREEAKQDVIRRLGRVNGVSELSVLPIVGMGGIGKTTLAKLVYHDVQLFDLKLWVCVSDTFRIPKIIEDILKDGTGDSTPNQEMCILVRKLHSLLSGKKYLLVLDDVWVEEFGKWKELKDVLAVGNPGSVLLITTRNSKVASITQTFESYDLDSLPIDVCWSMFKQLAFKDEVEEAKYPNLCEIGRSIVKKCHGIPLVVNTLASLLRSVREEQEWQRINDMESFPALKQQYGNVLPLLKLSYDKLPSHLKPCFAHMSLYVKDTPFTSNIVSHMWSALGLLPLDKRNKDVDGFGYSYIREMTSMFLVEESNVHIVGLLCESKMHDLLHDLAVNIMAEELVVVTLDKMTGLDQARHVVWGYDNLKEEQFPTELLRAKRARSFRFGYIMKHVSMSFLEGIISNLSCLRVLGLGSLWFEELPKSIGNLKHLRYLDLSCNPIMKSLPNTICNLLNLEVFNIGGCEQLKELPRDIHQLQSLKLFIVTTCQESLVNTKLNELSSLQSLHFHSCKSLISLWDSDNIGLLNSLKCLSIVDCPKLTSLIKGMKYLVNLQILDIRNCEELDMNKGEALQGLQSLRALQVSNVKMASLPNDIQSAATSLQYLCISHCEGLVELPEWLHCFTSLEEFEIEDCPNVLGLPKCISQINSLQRLIIKGCPNLSKRCDVPDGEDYPLIQHIPIFVLDCVTFTANQSH
ncbi:putative disease resistance protein RGA3 [Chenopodium quinoa]|uniref:Disease resistance protein RGA3 n=1 Tax=Chenopodium quinoa TaxID=63459 RepID=A0A803MAE9_CHEQI|nr:putative disease resistance protein RGA3 [Chenopodium quinoa]